MRLAALIACAFVGVQAVNEPPPSPSALFQLNAAGGTIGIARPLDARRQGAWAARRVAAVTVETALCTRRPPPHPTNAQALSADSIHPPAAFPRAPTACRLAPSTRRDSFRFARREERAAARFYCITGGSPWPDRPPPHLSSGRRCTPGPAISRFAAMHRPCACTPSRARCGACGGGSRLPPALLQNRALRALAAAHNRRPASGAPVGSAPRAPSAESAVGDRSP
jgi:hypothetical protein